MNKEKLAHFHRENILDAADKLYRKNGFDKTTIDMIAAKAEYSKPTIYSLFESKEEIYACNLYKYMLSFKNDFEEILSSNKKTIDVYLDCCHEVVKFKDTNTIYFQGLIGSLDYKNMLKGNDSIFAIGELGNNINNKVCKVFDQGIKEKVLDPNINVKFAYTYIWSCVMGIVTSPKLQKECFESEKEYTETLDKCFLKIVEGFCI